MDSLLGLDWDAGNLAKCQRHGVSIAEIESVFAGEPRYSPDKLHSISDQRFIAVGQNSEGRAIFIAFTLRDVSGGRLVRPISARYMHAKEAARYGKETGSSFTH